MNPALIRVPIFWRRQQTKMIPGNPLPRFGGDRGSVVSWSWHDNRWRSSPYQGR